MQLLGAWIMSTPRSRTALTARFIAGASSPTRRVAPLHQCWSHMSQMMIAVFAGSHSRVFSLTVNPAPCAGVAASRSRACRTSGLAAGASPPRAAHSTPIIAIAWITQTPVATYQATSPCSRFLSVLGPVEPTLNNLHSTRRMLHSTRSTAVNTANRSPPQPIRKQGLAHRPGLPVVLPGSLSCLHLAAKLFELLPEIRILVPQLFDGGLLLSQRQIAARA